MRYRLLNHWDNPDGSVERGYAGRSLWKWDELPQKADPRYADYARAKRLHRHQTDGSEQMSTAGQRFLTGEFLEKVAALADVFRPWGIRVYLSVKFTSPMEIGGWTSPTRMSRGPPMVGRQG